MILARRLLVPTLLGVVFAAAAIVFIGLRSQHSLIVERENEEMGVAHTAFRAMLGDRAEMAQALAVAVADMQAVQAAYAAGDRQALETLMKPMYHEMRHYFRVAQIQFHLPPATAFLRLEAPQLFGDDVSAFRRSVVRSNADKSPQTGLEAGRTGIAMRGVVPIVHERRYVGVVGFGIELDRYFLDQFKARAGAETAVYLTQRIFGIMTASGIAAAGEGPLPELGLLAKTGDMAVVSKALFERALGGETVLERIVFHGRPYVVGLEPVSDYNGDIVGVLQLDFPRERVLDRIAANRNASLLIGGAIALLAALAVWRLTTKRLEPLEQLTAGVRRLESGDRAARVDIAADDELGELGNAFNVMAAQLEQTLRGLEHNVAERKRAEEEVRSLNRDLERRVAERTAALEAANCGLEAANKELEAFSYSVSHDLRAPLRAIDGFAHILMEDYGDRLDEEAKKYFKTISANANRMGELIDDLLSFSRMSRLTMAPTPIDMTALVRDVFEELRAAEPERDIELRLGELPAARGDRSMIRQAVFNLLSNAVKFTARKARTIIEVDGVAEDGHNAYRFQDNGAGFDMQHANMLFGVFQRLHSPGEFEGTGIGLAIVKRIVDRHGGKVWADGKVGEGACFHFTLPQA